jgi:hypothetical protein
MAHEGLVPNFCISKFGSARQDFPQLAKLSLTATCTHSTGFLLMTAPAASYPIAGFVYFIAHPQVRTLLIEIDDEPTAQDSNH